MTAPDTVLVANPGADLYGSDRMVLETVRALKQDSRRVVVTVPNTGPLLQLLEEAGAEVVVCDTPIIRKGLLNAQGLVGLFIHAVRSVVPGLRVIRSTRAKTVLVNTITPPLWFPLAKLSGCRTLCHVHEAEASVPSALKRALYLPLAFCDGVIINSRFSLMVLQESAPRIAKRATIVYNAVAGPPEVVPPRASIEGPVRLLFIGRLSYRKGPHVAIEAMSILQERGVDAHLDLLGAVFPGNEAYEADLHEAVERHGLGERVTFLGFRPSIWDEVAGHDIVVVPSTVDEPFGNTAVEATLAARPLVVSDIAGLKEAAAYASASRRVEPSNPAAIADAVEDIVSKWSAFVAGAVHDSSLVAEQFGFQRYADELLNALENKGQGEHA